MVETIRNALTWIREAMDWAPNEIVGLVILAIAVKVAFLLHAALFRLLRRLSGVQHSYSATILIGTSGQTRLVFLILAMIIALPVAPFDPAVEAWLVHLLMVCAIGVAGWIAITTSHLVADRYLNRFKIDETDNVIVRKHITQIRVLLRVIDTLLIVMTVGAALMTFEPVRHYGLSLFASAGVAGLVAGLAARPVLSNLIAGIQLAVTQPIRIEDAVIVENEFGRIEEITSTYVVVRLWDMRRMIVPLTYFIEKPFQNWTRETSNQVGNVMLSVDYATPVDRIRQKAEEIVTASPLWDRGTIKVQVIDADDKSMQLRVLASARNASDTFDLRCEIREKLIDFLQRELPGSLPHQRHLGMPGALSPTDTAPQPR